MLAVGVIVGSIAGALTGLAVGFIVDRLKDRIRRLWLVSACLSGVLWLGITAAYILPDATRGSSEVSKGEIQVMVIASAVTFLLGALAALGISPTDAGQPGE